MSHNARKLLFKSGFPAKRQKGKTTNNTSFIFFTITIVIIKEQQQDKIDDNSNHNHHHYHQSLAIPIVSFESEASTVICSFGKSYIIIAIHNNK